LTLVEPRTATADAGAVVFARYAVPPNDLGYCGPDDSDGVLSGAAAGVVGPGLAERARAFDGAWVYLELIAAAAGARPLDARVVEAYWLGTALAGQVEPAAFAAAVRARFAGQSGGTWDGLGEAGGVVPHHGFHVFAVYPWLGLLRAGAPGEWVSLHWDRTCDVLGPAQLAALRASTAHQLAVSNATATS
jgi:Family of unknown function (DUF6390)